jgi:hypothetical protein
MRYKAVKLAEYISRDNPTAAGLSALFDGLLRDPVIDVPTASHALIALYELLAHYASFFPGENRDKFLSMRISDILALDRNLIASQIGLPLDENMNAYLAGNYRIRGRRAPAGEPTPSSG